MTTALWPRREITAGETLMSRKDGQTKTRITNRTQMALKGRISQRSQGPANMLLKGILRGHHSGLRGIKHLMARTGACFQVAVGVNLTLPIPRAIQKVGGCPGFS
jgi:hypothetical protein